MGQVPIQTGVRVKDGAFRKSYPVNLQHKLVESGVSKGELVTTRGAREVSTGSGTDRGGIAWNGVHYRVMGDQLCSIAQDGTVTELGEVANDGLLCSFAVSFDRLGVTSADRLYYFDGTTLTEVTDPDLGLALDVTWIDGYFATTDGESVVVTELNDPAAIDPLKYGSAESDPDAITGVDVLREDLVILGRYSIQFQRNIGGNGYPFQNIRGAMIPFGCVSAQAKCHVAGTIAFVGGAKDEPLGVFLIAQGTALRISDEEIDDVLNGCGDATEIALEVRSFGDEQHLVVHAGECSAALAMRGSQEAEAGLWHKLDSKGGKYRPRNAVYCYGAHYVGDVSSNRIGILDSAISAHFGEEPGWSFDAGLLYNDGRGFILHCAEITGQFPETAVFFSVTRDGELWSREVARRLTGKRNERVAWRPGVHMPRISGMRFRGSGKVAIARVDAEAEPLNA